MMVKANKTAAMGRLQSAARLSRTALAARLLTHGFYAGQDQIMIALHHENGQTPGQLASRLGVRPPTITKTINRLQMQGFLGKKASETDARQAHVFLTDAGIETIRAIEKSRQEDREAGDEGARQEGAEDAVEASGPRRGKPVERRGGRGRG